MSVRIGVSITGLDPQITRFKNAELNLQNFEIGEIINWALDIVKREAQSNAPFRTGTLRNSIVNYMISDLAGECVAMAPYAPEVEFGYVNRAGVSVPGRKFFTPAAIHGGKALVDELRLYVIRSFEGKKIRPKTATRTSGGKGSITHKYLYKVQTGAGPRYVYSKKSTTVTSYRPLLYPGTGKAIPKRRAGRRSRGR